MWPTWASINVTHHHPEQQQQTFETSQKRLKMGHLHRVLSFCFLLVVVFAFNVCVGGEESQPSSVQEADAIITSGAPLLNENHLLVAWESSEETKEAYSQFCALSWSDSEKKLEEFIGKIGVNGVLDSLSKKGNKMCHHIGHKTGLLAAGLTNNFDLLWQAGGNSCMHGYFHAVTEKLVMVCKLSISIIFIYIIFRLFFFFGLMIH